MSSSDKRGQVDPLPALLAVALFAIGLSLYGVTLEDARSPISPGISDATMVSAESTLTEGTVVQPSRMDALEGELPADVAVRVRADDREWQHGDPPEDPSATRRQFVLVRTESGEVPGIMRVMK
ncbi:MAG: DUF7285 family protein [Halodesulfurarchaeum sp.]